ncbi:heme peroxidase [Cladochytrium replicatum]|nr:heme peroxidase [Cladochytrium replicatum]
MKSPNLIILGIVVLTICVYHVSALACPLGYTIHDPTLRNRAHRRDDAVSTSEADAEGRDRSDDNRFCPQKNLPVDYDAVKQELKITFKKSLGFWPADFGNYAPFMVRLAWHCSGSYRISDGRGGCDGARIRFLPELAWDDNTNLEKARKILEPVKAKFCAISWGDLILLAGNTALESMGVPNLNFCGGRVDDGDGSASLELGPSVEQETISNCTVQGECSSPLGAIAVGLIYVNPEGHLGDGDPVRLSSDVREVFSRMGHDDRNTVSLIAGGHTFGKTHGACTTGPGPSPLQQPNNPWPGTCFDKTLGPFKGKGANTFTSGFEGPWTTQPTNWTNLFLRNLFGFEWNVGKGPGGKKQFFPSIGKLGIAPPSGIRMLTSDIALLKDQAYHDIAVEFNNSFSLFGEEFAKSWYKLTSQDMGPAWRCKGNNVAKPQAFQLPLPAATGPPPKLEDLAKLIVPLLNAGGENLARFVTLAYNCASTFRQTDHHGGCNGARILIPPESDLKMNAGLLPFFESTLKTIKTPPAVSAADLIAAAGTVALKAAGVTVPFLGGRVDLASVNEFDVRKLAPRTYHKDNITTFKDDAKVRGMSLAEAVALHARPRSKSQQIAMGFSGSFSDNPATSGPAYCKILIGNEWVASTTVKDEFVAKGKKGVFMTIVDIAVRNDPETGKLVKAFAGIGGDVLFKSAFASGWNKIMNSDLPPKK